MTPDKSAEEAAREIADKTFDPRDNARWNEVLFSDSLKAILTAQAPVKEELESIKAILGNPEAVHLNMLRGTIATPSPYLLLHLAGAKYQAAEQRAETAESHLSSLTSELEKATAHIPEGYRVAKDTLSERVALMAGGLRSFQAHREDLQREIQTLTSERDSLKVENEVMRSELCKANNCFGSECHNWPDLWKRIEEVRRAYGDATSERDELKAQCWAVVNGLKWFGDGYQWNNATHEWSPTHGDYREEPEHAMHRAAREITKQLQSLQAENERLKKDSLVWITCIHHNDKERAESKRCPVCQARDLTTLKAKLEKIEGVVKNRNALEKSSYDTFKEITSILKGGVCPVCLGNRYITIAEGERDKCPRCMKGGV